MARKRGIARQIDGKRFERLGDRIARAVGDGRDGSAAAVFKDHAFQQVVDVVHSKAELDIGIPLDLAPVFEIAHAGIEHDDFGQRQRAARLRGFVSLLRGGHQGECQQFPAKYRKRPRPASDDLWDHDASTPMNVPWSRRSAGCLPFRLA